MKNTFTLILSFLFLNISAQNISFTDVNLKTKLLQADVTNDIAQDNYGNNLKIDGNNDGEIQISETESIYKLNISNSNINNVSDLQNIQNLRELNCSYNNVNEINLNHLISLQILDCSHNNINHFLPINSPYIKSSVTIINCSYNNITNGDFTIFPFLQDLNCSFNEMTSINYLGNFIDADLKLNCSNNLLTSFDVKNKYITALDCSNNQITELNFQDKVAQNVTELNINNNPIINICKNENDIIPNTSSVPQSVCNGAILGFDAGLKKILLNSDATSTNDLLWNVKDINGNFLTVDTDNDGELSQSEVENIGYINFIYAAGKSDVFEESNGINYLKNLKGISGDIQTTYSYTTQNLGHINIDNLQNLEFINFYQFQVKSVKINNCPKLKTVITGTSHGSYGNTLFFEFKNCPLLETVNCIAGNLGALSFENCPAVKNIDVTGNKLNSLDVSMLPNLEKLFTRNYHIFSFPFDTLDFPNNGISSLDLSQNTKLVDLDCSKNSLNTLNFSNNPLLNHINCSKNNLTNLDVSNLNLLGGSNEGTGFSSFQPSLDCSDNQLTNLNLSNTNIAGLKCNNNQLTNLTNLDATHLQTLICSNNILTTLDVSNFLGLNYLDCSNNVINNLNVKNVYNLQELYCQHNSLNALNFENNNNLWAIYCNHNNLQELIVPNPAIVIFNNNPNLIYLNIKNGGQDTLEYQDNPQPFANTNLKFVCLDENEDIPTKNYIENYFSGIINFNTYCSFVPGGNYNTITGKVRFDENNNGCDENDEIFQHMKLKIDDGTNNGNTFVQNTGDYNFYTQSGNFTVTALPENPDLFSVTPATFSVNFADNNNNVTTQNICVIKTSNSNDLEVVIAPIDNARPGFPATYKLVYRNKGNTNLSGVVKLDFEGNKMSFSNSSVPYSAISTNSITYSFTNLKPFENKSIELEFTINPPTHPTFPVNLNDVLTFTANGNIIGNDILPEDNVFTLKQTVVGSFDPNDITCLEGNLIPETMIGEYLHYSVNFENTGTAEAENIVVEMDINPDDFDINTLQIQNATGEVYTRITGKKAEFIFKKIKLGSGGHGNVLLKVRTKSDFSKSNVIIANANIYFDYNFPVKTNDAVTQFYNYLNNHEITDKDGIKVYPIPAKDSVTIESKVEVNSIEIYDENGRILQKILNPNKKTKINIENFSKGIYYLILKSNNELKTKKIIKD